MQFSLKTPIKNILLIDIPTYIVKLMPFHRELMRKKLRSQSLLWYKRVGQKRIRPSLSYSRGLLTLASVLEMHGFAVKYLNYSDPVDRQQIYRLSNEADIVGITTLTPTYNIVRQLADTIKKINRNTTIILGGPHVTVRPAESLANCPSADFAMMGDSETRLPKLLQNLNNAEHIAGTVFRDEQGTPHVSTLKIRPVSVPDLPLPAYHLLHRSLSDYAHNIRTFRGCPYQCQFCLERLSWNTADLSRRTSDQTIAELSLLANSVRPRTIIHFSDTMFNLDWAYTGELVERIKKANLGLFFSIDTRVDLITEEQVKSLSAASFVCYRMGFESVTDKILALSSKAITHVQQRDASDIIRRVNDHLVIYAYMLTGLPGSTLDTLLDTTRHIKNLILDDWVDIISNKLLVPYPGTPFHELAQSFGVQIKTHDWSQYDRRSYPVYRLSDLSQDELFFGYLMQEAALTQAYFQKLHTLDVPTNNLTRVTSGLDYLFTNYVQAQ